MSTHGTGRIFPCFAAVLAVCCASTLLLAQRKSELDLAREKMVEEAVIGAGVNNKRVIQSMLVTPRHEFVAGNLRSKAYYDMALPIGDQQTISSPFIVAYMTESIDPQPDDKVLEIGTGSGYQAAILSPLVQDVFTIEIVESLGLSAERTLKRLKYDNVHVKVGDGFKGWPEHAPFDKIIVTCSPEEVPKPLVEQLKEGGLMVIPVGERYQQTLYLLRKKDGELVSEALRPTLFVPMTGAAEERREVKPDPKNPQAANGGFEEEPGENGFVPGWYYQRGLTWENDKLAPEGRHFITFNNDAAGRSAHLLQGLGIDGREIEALELSAHVRYKNVRPGQQPRELPMVAVTFFDSERKDLGTAWVGPFRGSSEWYPVKKTVRVPVDAREGILRVGLFGATGEVSFDDVRITPIKQ